SRVPGAAVPIPPRLGAPLPGEKGPDDRALAHLAASRAEAIAACRPKAEPRAHSIVVDIGDVSVRVTSVVLAAVSAPGLLDSGAAACFAPGACAGTWSSLELCRRAARILAERGATYRQRHMAVVAAMSLGRYKEMIAAMEEQKMEPVIIEDFVRFGYDEGLA